METDYGGVRQRWVLLEGEARREEEERRFGERVRRAEEEAGKAPGRLLAWEFSCEVDAQKVLGEVSQGLTTAGIPFT